MYRALAKFYEMLNDNCDQESWSHYLISLLEGASGRSAATLSGADLGCGTGMLTARLARAARIECACDLSPEMLNEAAKVLKMPLVCCDFSAFCAPHKLDFLTAANDGFNYVPGDRLQPLFSHLRRQLKKGGVLLFDLSSPHKLREVLGDNLFFDDGEDLTMFWQSSLQGDRVRFSLSFFERGPDGRYLRSDEEQTQYIHETPAVLSALEAAGFSAEAFDMFTREPVRAEGLRTQFVAAVR